MSSATASVQIEELRPEEVVLVVDFGAQYAQLIARRVREASVYSEIVAHTITAAKVAELSPRGIILSGGPKSVHVDGSPQLDPAIYELGIPILGICYGAQLIAQQMGGVVGRSGQGEYGRTVRTRSGDSALFGSSNPSSTVWMSHFDAVTEPPEGFVSTAITEVCPAAAIEDADRKIFGVQWHPEVSHSEGGQDLIRTFVREICQCSGTWDMSHFVDSAVKVIAEQVGTDRAICGLSGGVDSAVAAALVHRAIGAQLTCVFVDTGLMRKDEGEQVEKTFHEHQGMELVHLRAEDRFFDRLAGLTDPEDKRKAIGELFVRLSESAAGGVSDAKYLVQGTLYPDVIESGTATAATIKSHHNVGGLPEDIEFALVEPLRLLFKDEVRALGTELGLPDSIVWRQPFPGPGLAVRILGEVTRDNVALLREADAIVRQELTAAGLDREIWQAFAVLAADVRSVGVMGDERTYGHPIIVRAVTSEDAMTADWARIPYDVLDRISSRVISEVPGVNRVVFVVWSKPPGTIEWE